MDGRTQPGVSGPGPYRGKRVVDLVLLAVVAVPAALVAIPCAVAVKLTSRGPVLFRQSRVGRDGRAFEMVKFRTMLVGDNPIFPDESRITPAGRWLRRSSLDELPNLINVLRGDMSLIGTRPTLPAQVAQYTERQRGRLAIRPGITGWAQVNGRAALPWSERIELDLYYIEHRSPALDLRILARTVAMVLGGSGLYKGRTGGWQGEL